MEAEELLREIAHLKELLEERKEFTEKALALQAAEYDRRLAILNGEAARLREMQATYMPRESCAIQHKEIQKIITDYAEFISVARGKSQGVSGTLFGLVTVITLAMSLTGITLAVTK